MNAHDSLDNKCRAGAATRTPGRALARLRSTRRPTRLLLLSVPFVVAASLLIASSSAQSPAPTETIAKVGVSGATPPGGSGPTTIDWTITYGLTSNTTSPLPNIVLNDTWSAGQTLVAGSVKTPGSLWTTAQPNSTSLTFTNALNAPNGQGVTQAFPRPLGAGVTFTGSGDGFNPVITASGKLMGVNHHSKPTPIWCFDMKTGAACPGYKKSLNVGTGYAPKTIAIGNKIYFSDDSSNTSYAQTGHIYCWDSDTDSACGQSPQVFAQGLALVNGKFFTLTAAGSLDCFDPSNALNRCGGFTPVSLNMPTGNTNNYQTQGGDLFAAGSKVYVSNYQRKLTCFDSDTNAICAGWPALPSVVNTTASGNPRYNIFPRLSAAGAITGICVAGKSTNATCYDLNSGNPTEVPMSATHVMDPGMNATVDTNVGSRVFFPNFTGAPGLSCWDWATNARCVGSGFNSNGITTADANYGYGLTTDGINVFSFGDSGILRSWDALKGTTPAARVATTATVKIDDFYCASGASAPAAWDKVKLSDVNLTSGVEFTSLKISLVDPATGGTVYGPVEAVGTTGVFDVSSVSSSIRSLQIVADETPVGTVAWNDNVPPKATLTFASSAPVEFCYQTTVSCTGAGQAHTNTISTTLDPHSVTASVESCALTPNLAVTKSAPSPSLVPGHLSTYTITVTNNGSAPAASALVKEGLPIGLDLVSASGAGWSCSPSTLQSPAGTVACARTGGALAVGDASTISVTVQPRAAYAGATVINYVSVDPAGGANAPAPTTCTGLNTPKAGCAAPVTSTVGAAPPNNLPVSYPQSVATVEDVPLAVTLNAADADSNFLFYSVASAPAHGSLSGQAPNLLYTPAPHYHGPDAFTFKANDGFGDSNTATVTITVAQANTAPRLKLPADITAEATDASGAVVSYAATADDDQDGTLAAVCTPPSGGAFPLGTTPVNCTVTDSAGATDSGSFNVTVADTKAPAVTAPADQTAVEGARHGFSLGSFTDVVGPWTVDVDWGDGSAHTTFSASSAGTIATQDHTYVEEGAKTVTVKVMDGSGSFGSATFSVSVADAVLTPVSAAVAGFFNTGVDGTGAVLGNGATDPHYTITTAPSGYTGSAKTIASNVYPLSPAGPWMPNSTTSRWIIPGASNANGSAPEGDYTYHTTFDLTGFNPDTATITGKWATDNPGTVYLNGQPTGVSSNGFTALYPFNITSGFVPGVNTLDFVVTNLCCNNNPTGLRMEVSASAAPTTAGATGGFTLAAAEGSDTGLQTVAQFRDSGGAEPNASVGGAISDHYSASINWGDSSAPTAGAISYDSATGIFTVKGQHTYDDNGAYAVSVSITHGSLAPVTAQDTANVSNVAPTAVLSNGGDAVYGTGGSVSFSGQSDPSSADAAAGLRYAFDYDNNGTWEVGNGTYASSSTSASATLPASLPVGSHTVRGRIIDKDGGFTDYTTTFNVTKAAPVVTWNNPADITYGTALGAPQLNASADVPGSFAYSPAAGEVLGAGNGQTLSVTFTPTDATNYTNATKTVSINVNKAQLTVKADDKSKTYGAANPALTATTTGYVNGDGPSAVSGAPALSTTAAPSSGAGQYPITAAQGTLAAVNYSFTFAPGTLTVDPAALTVKADDSAKTYGAPLPPFTASYSGLVNGDTAAALAGTLAFNTAATDASPVGPYSVTPAGLTSPNYTITFAAGTLSVTPAALTVKADDKTKTYGDPNPAFSVSYSGFVLGESQSVLGGTLAFSTPATASSGVGSYPVTPLGLTSANYTITFADGTLTVSKKALTVTANDKSRTYGSANPALDGTIIGVANNDPITPNFLTAATQSSGAGSYAITITLNDPTSKLGNYDVTLNNGTLTVNTAALTVTADDKSKVYGTANPAFTASYSGLVNGDAPASLGGALAFSTPATATSAVGTYHVTPSGVTSPNYTISFIDGTLSVTKATLTITADDKSKVYGAPNPALTFTPSGFVNGDTASTPSVFTGAPTLTTAPDNSAVGSYTINAAAGTLSSANYSFNVVNGTLTVTKAVLTITPDNKSKIYGGAVPQLTYTPSGFVNGDTAATAYAGSPALATAATNSSPVGGYAINASQNTLASANYSFAFVGGTLSVTKAPLTITADNKSKQYSDPLPALTVSYSGFVLGETPAVLGGALVVSTTATALSPQGTYPITPSGSTSGNYAITFAPGNLAVSLEDATITYTGTQFLLLTTAGTSGTVTLSAQVQEAADGFIGNTLGGKQIQFKVFKATDLLMTTPLTIPNGGVVTLSNTATPGTAVGSMTASLPADTYTVQVQLLTNSFYTAPVEDAVLTISDPGMTTGGGWLVDPNTANNPNGDRSNFGFNVKYQKSGNAQGNSLFIYRTKADLGAYGGPAGMRDYNFIVKSNSMGLIQQSTTTSPKTAKFSGKCTIKAVDRLTGLVYDGGGGYSFQVDVADKGEPGSGVANPDSYATRITDSYNNNLIVAGTYSGSTNTAQIGIKGGNIQVK